MADVQDLLVRIDATTESLRRELKRAEQAVDGSTRKIDAATKRMDLGFRSVTSAAMKLAGAFGIAFGARGLVMHVGAQLRSADEMLKLTQRIGGTTEALSELQHVANLSGVSFNTMTMGLQRMTRRIAEAAQGTGEARAAIRELGLDARTLATLSLDQQFETLAGRLALVRNESDRVRLAMKLFDSEGVALLQTMTRGAEGIREMREELRRMGGTLTTEQAEAAAKARDEITRLTTSWQAFARTLTLKVIPPLTEVLEYLNRGGDAFEAQLAARVAEWESNVTDLESRLAHARTKLAEEEGGIIQLRAALRRQEVAALEAELSEAEGTLERLRTELERLQKSAEQSNPEAPEIALPPAIDPLGELQARPMRRIIETQRDIFDRATRRAERTRIAEEERQSQEDFQRLVEELRTQEEVIEASYQKRLDIILRNTEEGSQAQVDLLKRLDEQTDEQLQSLAGKAGGAFSSFGETLGRSLQESLVDYFSGIETDFDDMLKRMGMQLLTSQLFSFLGGLGGPAGKAFSFLGFGQGSLPTRHTGGPVNRGHAYKVKPDEEVFIPAMSGNVVPISKMGGAASVSINVINNTGAQADAQVRQTGPGMFDVILNAAGSGIATGRLDSVMAGRYGLRPVTGQR